MSDNKVSSLSISDITGELEIIHRASPSFEASKEEDPEAVRALEELDRRERAFLLELEERRLRERNIISMGYGL